MPLACCLVARDASPDQKEWEICTTIMDDFMTPRIVKRVFVDITGFTIAEIMAAAGVFAILVAVAIPNYLAFQPNLRLNGASREVLGKLMWARSKAVEENVTYDVTFPTDHTLEIRKSGVLIQTIDIEPDYSGITLSKSGVDPAFNSRGTAGGATTITLNGSSGSKTVTVTAAGNVRIN